jgi:type IV pilus assembly protein PilO
MATKSLPKIDFAALQEGLLSQFKGLNPNDPASWPALPRYAACVALMFVIVVALWFVWLSGSDTELEAERAREAQLREDFTKKLNQAVNLDTLKKQRVTGRYHDMGAFASDMANLSRIVTLNNLSIAPSGRDGGLVMEATAKTFRYLDKDEVAAQRKVAGPGGAKK